MPDTLTLASILHRNAEQRPDKVAIYFGEKQYTFAEHYARACSLAQGLSRLGCASGDRIAILSKNSATYLELYSACDLAGFILVPVNFRLTVTEVEWVLDNTRPRVFFFTPEYEDIGNSLCPGRDSLFHSICLEEMGSGPGYAGLPESSSADVATFSPAESDGSCIVHTSGTTGRAKGAVLGQGGLASVARAIASDAELDESDIGLVMQPLFHVGARFLQLAHHSVGAAIRLETGFEPARVWQTLASQNITTIQVVPTMLAALLDQFENRAYPETALKTIFYSTAPIGEDLLRRGLSVFGQVFLQQYGSTEAGQVSRLSKSMHIGDGTTRQQAWLKSAGQANPGVEIRIIDEEGKSLAQGETGEISVRAPWMFLRYWNDETATQSAMQGEFLRTGDMGYLDQHGFLFIVDRKKDMIISGGENIYAREVELALEKHGAVQEVAVIGVPDQRWGESVLAVVACARGQQVTEAELIAHCQAQIASYKKPGKVVFIDSLPRNTMGKVDKPALRAPWWQDQEGKLV